MHPVFMLLPIQLNVVSEELIEVDDARGRIRYEFYMIVICPFHHINISPCTSVIGSGFDSHLPFRIVPWPH